MRVTLLPLFPACISESPAPVILFATVTEPLGRLNVKVPPLLTSLDPRAPDAVPLPICKVPLVIVVVEVPLVPVRINVSDPNLVNANPPTRPPLREILPAAELPIAAAMVSVTAALLLAAVAALLISAAALAEPGLKAMSSVML